MGLVQMVISTLVQALMSVLVCFVCLYGVIL